LQLDLYSLIKGDLMCYYSALNSYKHTHAVRIEISLHLFTRQNKHRKTTLKQQT